MELAHITEKIIGAAFMVHNVLGAGFLEKVYENALCYELKASGLSVQQQHRIEVAYKGVSVGDYQADLIVERCCLVEMKAVKILDQNHQAQVMNYLKATGLKTALLLNFGSPRLQIKRFVM